MTVPSGAQAWARSARSGQGECEPGCTTPLSVLAVFFILSLSGGIACFVSDEKDKCTEMAYTLFGVAGSSLLLGCVLVCCACAQDRMESRLYDAVNDVEQGEREIEIPERDVMRFSTHL